MRRFTFFLLLATAASPGLAAPEDEGGRRHRNSDAEQTESRPQRSERAAARQQSQSEERRYGAQRSERAQPAEQGMTETIRERIQERREARQQATSNQSDANEPTRTWRRRDGNNAGETQSTWRPRERRLRTIPDTHVTEGRPATIEPPTSVTRHRRDYRDGNYRRWTDSWRHDRRYDWRRYRDRNRSLFRLGFYYDPFGWSYRRWSLGSFLWPSYYGSRYWLNDPWYYRLPPAYGPYRWVRYWDDALLVNIYTGQVVDVIHNFFW